MAFATALNSASVDDLAIVCHFLEEFEIKLDPENTQYVLVDFRSLGHPTQSASEYAVMFIDFDLENNRP